MLTNSGSQEHIHSSCHIQTKLIENFFCLIFDGFICSDIQICVNSQSKCRIRGKSSTYM